jgi:hypothetical protein
VRAESEAWHARRRRLVAITGSKAEKEAARELVRVERAGLKFGDEVKHKRGGLVVAVCTYVAARRWLYNGNIYSSLFAAAKAAAKDLELPYWRRVYTWTFWGLEKQERGRFVAQRSGR